MGYAGIPARIAEKRDLLVRFTRDLWRFTWYEQEIRIQNVDKRQFACLLTFASLDSEYVPFLLLLFSKL